MPSCSKNAFIETGSKLNLSIPKNLQAQGDPGAYIVQAHGPTTPTFRTVIAAAGATIVSYIPNNAYLVKATGSAADGLAANPLVQAAIPYEPYYKVQAPLLAMADQQLPGNVQLNLGLYANDAAATIQQIQKMGGVIVSEEDSPAGYPIVKVVPPANWTAVAALPGVHIVEPYYHRALANDLARPMLGISVDSTAPTNYFNLYGSNVIVEVNDTGIDTNHPDFGGSGGGGPGPERVSYLDPANGVDFNGHGTHVAGIIAGDGFESTTVTNASNSPMPGTNGQFRGKAPFAKMLSMNFQDSDEDLQEAAANTNALISNNSWVNGDFDYDLEAASYDAATRDALPFTTHPQPVLFVFAAGDAGDGGTAGTVESPATAKDVMTVGALEELRDITNQVTNADGTVSEPWLPWTDNSSTVVGFSSDGNVGIGIEGTFGRFKPDVVAPGTFVVSCRSEQWDTNAYYHPTNNTYYTFPDFLQTNSVSVSPFQFFVPPNAVNVIFDTVTNPTQPIVLPTMPIYVSTNGGPFGFIGTNFVEMAPGPNTLNQDWSVEVSNVTLSPLPYILVVDVQTTNAMGNYWQVLQGMNDNLGTDPEWYRYESGTSMSAPAISGYMALIQDYFTNQLGLMPSPAMLKALTINGARSVGEYDFQVNNSINLQGWGLPNLENSVPVGLTNIPTEGDVNPGPFCSTFFRDQSITNALATGDRETFTVNLNTNFNGFSFPGNYLPLRVSLAWTDPPGDPAASLKLVNSLELVVTDLDDQSVVYYGNDIAAQQVYNTPENSSNAPVVDTINNIQNIYIYPFGTNAAPDADYSVTVIGNSVNVNAVSGQTNNTVQDFALVISAGDMGQTSNALMVTDNGIVSNPTGDRDITIGQTNTLLLNQIAGANTPLLGTNIAAFTTNTINYGTNGQFVIGMTNQWHFYIVTNSTTFSNAAFITFGASTLSIPRMGVFADSLANSTTPGADLDMLVTSTANDPNAINLLTLDPNEVSNCVNNVSGDGSYLGYGGTDFVTYTNAQPNAVYYVGIKSENHMGAIYGFIPIFSQNPFSGLDQNGNEYLYGLNVPAPIPDGTPSHPGISYVFSIGMYPITIQNVIVTNIIYHQNFGDLIGSLTHNGTSVVLNNHDSLTNPPPPGPYELIYDDSGDNATPGSRHTDGPGSLQSFTGAQGSGLWQMIQEGTVIGQTGLVQNTYTFLQKYQNPADGITAVVQPGQWFYTYVTVPAGVTNLQLYGAYDINNTYPPTPPPLQMYLNTGSNPTFGNFLFEDGLTNQPLMPIPTQFLPQQPVGPWNVISDGPPLQPGTYYIGVFNPGSVAQTVYLLALLNGPTTPPQPQLFSSTNSSPILNDGVTNTTIFVANTNTIQYVNVGMVVQYPRISDLAFTLISPSGQRILLMEQRGGPTSTNAGGVFYITNSVGLVTASGSYLPQTNSYPLGGTSGSFVLSYNMYTIPDQITVYYGTNNFDTNSSPSELLYDSGMVSGTNQVTITYPPAGVFPNSSYITIIMNQYGNTNAVGGDAWTYSLNGVVPDYNYLTFTEDTNLTITPIKFAIPPFDLRDMGTNFNFGNLDLATNGDYFAQTNIYDTFGGWTVPTNLVTQVTNGVPFTNNYNEVSIVSDPAIAFGSNTNSSNYMALGYGVITRTNLITPYRLTSFNFVYRGPGIAGWWRGEGNANDASDAEQLGQNGSLIGRFNFPAGEVSQSFEMENNGSDYDFAGTNSYVQIRQQPFYTVINTNGGSTEGGSSGLETNQSSYLDVGVGPGFTVEGWINPTNLSNQQPLVEWLARVPTNGSDPNLSIRAGPFLNWATGHYYYMLAATNWTTSETWAEQIGGHLVTLDTANEQNWVYDTFANYGGRNRNLWIGLTNIQVAPNIAGNFGYSSGLTNITYTNWLNGQPESCDPSENYTLMLGATNTYPGLWVTANNKGIELCEPITNICYGVVEVTNLQTNGVQFWISVTNVPGTTNLIMTNTGCLFANLVDTTNGSHWIYSGPNLIQTNVFQHVALTYDTNSGEAMLFYNGTNVATTNWGMTIIPKTTGDVLLGKDMSMNTNNYFGGMMDEMSIYSRALSDAEIAGIYSVSAYTTNRLIGKFDPTITPPLSLAEAQVILNGQTNTILGDNTTWQAGAYTFTSLSNSLPIQINGLEPGILFDAFSISQAPLGNLYYQPEQSLDELQGENASGNWTLEIWDTRNNTLATNVNILSWQLQMILQTNALSPVTLGSQEATALTVPPFTTISLAIPVPAWAIMADNTLISSTLPLNVLFNQTNPPAGPNPTGIFMFSGTSGDELLSTNSAPTNIIPGETYYIGLQNPGSNAASAVFEVNFNITALTNDVPFNATLATNGSVNYYSFTVSSNSAYEATFQLLGMSGDADLVVSKGAPLPTLTSSDYGSFNSGKANENIYVLTNSMPVPVSAGTWYLGVYNRDTQAVNYSVLAQELDIATNGTPTTNGLTLIQLTNNVPFDWTAGPGAALTNFFTFVVTNPVTVVNSTNVTNYVGSIHFELYNLTGAGGLTVQTNAPPFAPPFFQSSAEPGGSPQFIQIRTNSALTNLAATWYLGVTYHNTNKINYTILAVIDTNSYFPAFPGAEGAGGGTPGGSFRNLYTNNTVYHVVNLNDSGTGSLRDAVNSTNRTVVFDISGDIYLQTPLVITNSYLSIEGQTAPEGGITVAGATTEFSPGVHDIAMRFLRFRPLYMTNLVEAGSGGNALQFNDASNVIMDHVSALWSPNTDLAVYDSTNITVQWSILADSLVGATSGAGGGSVVDTANASQPGGGVVTLSHNLYADNAYANPQFGGNNFLDFVNNVVYDWGTNAGISDNQLVPVSTNCLNFRCNYVIASTNSFTNYVAFWGGTTNTWIFQTNNFIDCNTNGILDGANTRWDMFTNAYTETNAFPLADVSVDEAFRAYEKVLDFAGVSMFRREPAESNIVENVRTQTGTIISKPGILLTNTSTLIYVNSTGDGIPDFWKITFGQAVTNSYNNFVLSSGYSELEEFDNWLAGPHAVTVTNTPVGVNLQKLFGKTGNLTFYATNAINGTVYLTNVLGSYTNSGIFSNTIAIFTPTNGAAGGTNFQGFGSFDIYVTNNDTVAWFGPVTVSVFVGGTQPTYSQFVGILLPDPTNTIGANTIQWYQVNVPTNAVAATNILSFAGEDLNLWYSTNYPPTTVFPSDVELLTAVTSGVSVVTTNGPPTLVPGGTYYLGVQNTNNAATTYAVGLGFNTTGGTPPTGPQTNTIPVGGVAYFAVTVPQHAIAATNIIDFSTGAIDLWFNQTTLPTFGGPGDYQMLSGFSGATPGIGNPILTLTSTPVLEPNQTYYLAVTNDSAAPVTFAIEVDFDLFYTPPFLPVISNQVVVAGNTLVVTNAAMDTNSGSLYYSLTTQPTVGATINTTNGIITWAVPTNEPGMNVLFTTVVTNSFTDQSATNSFTVTVIPQAPITGPQTNTVPAGGLNWFAVFVPTNAIWATNTLLFANLPVNTLFTTNFPPSTNGTYTLMSNETNGTSILGLNTVPTNIVPGGVYYLGIQNTNSAAVTYAIEVTFDLFFAPAAPFSETLPATLVTGNSAQLNGFATANTVLATAWFEWGVNTNYGFTTAPLSLNGGNSIQYVTNSISLPIPGQVYHYRLDVSNALGVAHGEDQLLAVSGVAAWGDNAAGVTNVPLGLSNEVAIAAEAEDGVALNSQGKVTVWGDNTYSQTQIPANLTNVANIAAGNGAFALALQNGVVTGWGNNSSDQTSVPAGLSNVVAIAAGESHGLALQNNGTVVAWGANGYGQTSVPLGLNNVVAIAAGSVNSLALLNNGTLVAWGGGQSNTGVYPNYGQSIVPAGLTNVVSIASYGYTSTALKSDGTVVCWGENNFGQANVPGGLNNVVVIANGLYHSLAVQETGHAVGWGNNPYGEATVPAALTNLYDIAGGNYFSLALESPLSINLNISPITGGVPQTNSIAANSIVYYSVAVPTNAVAATNLLSFTTAPLNIWFNQTNLPAPANPPDTLLLGAAVNGATSVLTASSVPPLVPGQTYYLAIQNTNSLSASYVFGVNFSFTNAVVGPTNNPIFYTSIVYTNIGGFNGYLLRWFAPTNDAFQVQETPSLQPTITWNTFTNIITYSGPVTTTNGLFTFFDNGSQYPFGPTRFYRVLLLGSSPSVPVLPGNTPQTNSIAANSVNWLAVNVPTNAAWATNTLLFATNLPVNILFNSSPVTNNAYTLMANETNGISLLGLNTTPTNIVAGGTYYLGVQNTNNATITYALEVIFGLTNAGPSSSSSSHLSLVYTNISGFKGYLLTWYAPTDDVFQVEETPALNPPAGWNTFTNIITYAGPMTTTNGLFSFFDNGVEYPFGSTRFYRLLLLVQSSGLALPNPTNYVLNVSQPLTITNTATDSNPSAILSYNLADSPTPATNALISSNGIIKWTPGPADAGSAFTLTTIVADNGSPSAHATNAYTVFVMPAPGITNALVTATNVTLNWVASKNDRFQIEWAGNPAAPTWTVLPQIITSPSGLFSFTDTNAPLLKAKFYRLVWLP